MSQLTVDPIRLELGFDLVRLAKQDLGGTLVERIGRLREEILLRIGIKLPPIRLLDNFDIEGNQCALFIKGIKISRVSIDRPTNSAIPTSDASNPAKLIVEHLWEIFMMNASDLVDYDQINSLLGQTAVTYPALIAEFDRLFPRKSSLLKMMKSLLRTGGSIRNLPMILETLIEAGNDLTSSEIINLIQVRMGIRA